MSSIHVAYKVGANGRCYAVITDSSGKAIKTGTFLSWQELESDVQLQIAHLQVEQWQRQVYDHPATLSVTVLGYTITMQHEPDSSPSPMAGRWTVEVKAPEGKDPDILYYRGQWMARIEDAIGEYAFRAVEGGIGQIYKRHYAASTPLDAYEEIQPIARLVVTFHAGVSALWAEVHRGKRDGWELAKTPYCASWPDVKDAVEDTLNWLFEQVNKSTERRIRK